MSVFFYIVVGCPDPTGVVRIRYAPNKLREYYSKLSPRRKEIVNNCMFFSFFKCQQTAISGLLTAYLLDCYRGQGVVLVNETEVRFGKRDVGLIFGSSVTSTTMKETFVQVPSFRER